MNLIHTLLPALICPKHNPVLVFCKKPGRRPWRPPYFIVSCRGVQIEVGVFIKSKTQLFQIVTLITEMACYKNRLRMLLKDPIPHCYQLIIRGDILTILVEMLVVRCTLLVNVQRCPASVSYTHLRAHETRHDL